MIPPELLTPVLEHPADDTPRLVAADWLDEHAAALPDPAAARDRAELIRVQCRVAGGRAEPGDGGRAAALLGGPGPGGQWPSYEFARGFVAVTRPTLFTWQAAAAALLAADPLERVEVADVPGLVFEVICPGTSDAAGRVTSAWWLAGKLTVEQRRAFGTATGADWDASAGFETRPALVAGATAAVAEIVERLRAAAGDRWPGPVQ